jgi:hypothetical protein
VCHARGIVTVSLGETHACIFLTGHPASVLGSIDPLFLWLVVIISVIATNFQSLSCESEGVGGRVARANKLRERDVISQKTFERFSLALCVLWS